jgi:hypothetical protein
MNKMNEINELFSSIKSLKSILVFITIYINSRITAVQCLLSKLNRFLMNEKNINSYLLVRPLRKNVNIDIFVLQVQLMNVVVQFFISYLKDNMLMDSFHC